MCHAEWINLHGICMALSKLSTDLEIASGGSNPLSISVF
jgi:hypothetical protein